MVVSGQALRSFPIETPCKMDDKINSSALDKNLLSAGDHPWERDQESYSAETRAALRAANRAVGACVRRRYNASSSSSSSGNDSDETSSEDGSVTSQSASASSESDSDVSSASSSSADSDSVSSDEDSSDAIENETAMELLKNRERSFKEHEN